GCEHVVLQNGLAQTVKQEGFTTITRWYAPPPRPSTMRLYFDLSKRSPLDSPFTGRSLESRAAALKTMRSTSTEMCCSTRSQHKAKCSSWTLFFSYELPVRRIDDFFFWSLFQMKLVLDVVD